MTTALIAAVSVLSTPAANGYSQPSVSAVASETGADVHGSICRLRADALAPPSMVVIRRTDASGHVEASTAAVLNGGGLRGRGLGCAYYTAHTEWRLDDGERIVVAPAN